MDNGWARWVAADRTAEELAARIEELQGRLSRSDGSLLERDAIYRELGRLVAELRGELAEDELEREPAEEVKTKPAARGNGSSHV